MEEVQIKDMEYNIPFAKNQADSLNSRAKNANGSRKPSIYIGYVNDHLYVEMAHFLRHEIACSFLSADDTFGGSHKL